MTYLSLHAVDASFVKQTLQEIDTNAKDRHT